MDSAVNIFRATIPANVSPSGNAVTLDQTYSISKSRTGQTGSAGSDAKTVKLTSSGYAIAYDSGNANPSPSGTLTLTATASNFTNPFFKFTGDGITDETSYTDGASGASDSFSFTIPSSFFSTAKVVRVGVAESDAATTEIAFDSIAIAAVKDGGTGADAVTVILTNEAHSVPSDTDGSNPIMTGSGTSIQVFKGTTELNGITTGTPTSGQFRVTATPSNITTGNITSSGNPVVVGDHTSMNADTASISYSINVENTTTFIKKQSFTKSKKGSTGDDGQNTAEVKIYKRSSSDSAPAVPDGNVTYTFATGTVTDNADLDGWTLSPPATGGDFLYFCVATATSTGTTDVIATGDWSTPVRQTIEIPRKVFDTIFYQAYTSGDPQELTTSQLNGLRYDFSARDFFTSTLPSGWSNTRPTSVATSYSFAVIKIVETNFEGNS